MARGIFLLFFLAAHALSAQAISGYVNFEDQKAWKSEIYLSHVSLEEVEGESAIRPLTKVAVQENGHFKIDKKYFSDKNKIYRLHVERIRKIVNDSLKKEVTFLMSNRDSMVFPKGKRIFAPYSTTNQGDLELQNMKAFEAGLIKQYVTAGERGEPQKAYVKDSLRILMVKLIGIQQLAEKQLLDQDIAENPTYYLELLEELQESSIKPVEYWFLEKKLAYLTQARIEQQLQTSRWLNAGLFIGLVVLGFGVFWLRRRPKMSSPLSRQEENIKNLILQGKSNKEIADELFISLSTVKTHITHIYNKLQVTGRRELLQKGTGTST